MPDNQYDVIVIGAESQVFPARLIWQKQEKSPRSRTAFSSWRLLDFFYSPGNRLRYQFALDSRCHAVEQHAVRSGCLIAALCSDGSHCPLYRPGPRFRHCPLQISGEIRAQHPDLLSFCETPGQSTRLIELSLDVERLLQMSPPEVNEMSPFGDRFKSDSDFPQNIN
jgi:hypothetical protein